MPQLATNEVQTYYERTGNGPPVVFIHGLGWDHRSWRPQLVALGDEYELIAYDYRAHGQTEASTRRECTIELLVEDLRALLDELDVERPVLCGHSYGGLIAAEYAIQYPDDVTALAFADARTAMGESALERAILRLQPIFGRIASVVGRERFERAMAFVAERVTDMEQGPEEEEVPELGLTPSEYAEEAARTVSTDELSRFIAAGQDYVGTNPTDFNVPVLYAYGGLNQGVIADKADRLERAPTDVRVHEVENAGHGLMLEQPERFTDTLRDFLEDVTLTAPESSGDRTD
jgi:pimeloyl-ACP methyl ester carboxylesterase